MAPKALTSTERRSAQSAMLLEWWADPAYRAARSAQMREQWRDPAFRATRSEFVREQWRRRRREEALRAAAYRVAPRQNPPDPRRQVPPRS